MPGLNHRRDARITTSQETHSFDEWLDYCFTRGIDDFNGRGSDSDSDAADARIDRFEGYSPRVGEHLLRLFESPEFLSGRFTDD